MARKNTVSKTWREALDLIFDFVQHVDRPTIGNVAIRPGRVLPFWRASGIKKARLRQQNEWPIRGFSNANGAFRGSEFLRRAAKVNGRRARAVFGLPRNRTRQRVIHFER